MGSGWRGSHLGHDVLQFTPGLVGAVVVAEAVHHLLVLELVLVRDWMDPGLVRLGAPSAPPDPRPPSSPSTHPGSVPSAISPKPLPTLQVLLLHAGPR